MTYREWFRAHLCSKSLLLFQTSPVQLHPKATQNFVKPITLKWKMRKFKIHWIPVSHIVSFNLFPPTESCLILKSTPWSGCESISAPNLITVIELQASKEFWSFPWHSTLRQLYKNGLLIWFFPSRGDSKKMVINFSKGALQKTWDTQGSSIYSTENHTALNDLLEVSQTVKE